MKDRALVVAPLIVYVGEGRGEVRGEGCTPGRTPRFSPAELRHSDPPGIHP